MGKLSWEEVYEKNPRERLKKEKHPLDILKELDALILKGYESIPEEDLVRLQWYGLYHDKPRVGNFVLRIKLPGGKLSADQLRAIGLLAKKFNNYAELTTRQDIQIHYVRLEDLPFVFDILREEGLFRPGACGDTVRNITSCPVHGIDRDELFPIEGPLRELTEFFSDRERKEYFDLPRKFKITLSACPYHCNYPEINDLSFVGTVRKGQEGFAVWVGGGLSSTPRIAKPLGIFVIPDKVLEVTLAVLDIWREGPENRKSFVKARMKYMVDRIGVEEFRRRLIERITFNLEFLNEEPKPVRRFFHEGIGRHKEEGLYYVTLPVPVGRITGEKLIQLSDLAGEEGLEIRTTQRQNIILAGIREDRLESVLERVKRMGFDMNLSKSQTLSIACTSDPFCNYSVGSTKEVLKEILSYLERELGDLGDVIIGVDGCPHACAHHWLNDIGLQATHIRHPDGRVESGLNIILGGGYGREADIGKIVIKRATVEEAKSYLKNLLVAYKKSDRRSFKEFIRSLTDEELTVLMRGEGEISVEKEKGVKVRMMGPLTKLTGGLAELWVEANSVRELINELDRLYPGVKKRLLNDKGEVKDAIKVFVNEEDIKYMKGLDTELKEGDEVQFILALAGGVR